MESKKKNNRFGEKIIESLLTLSGTVTSITVLLIVIFLFTEGLALFKQPPIEDSFVLAVHKSNPVKLLSPAQVKQIFDSEIVSWKQINGQGDSIHLFRIDDITKYFTEEQLGSNFEHLPQRINELIVRDPNIIAYLPKQYVHAQFAGKHVPLESISAFSFLGGEQWFPTAQPVAQLGALPLILGTLWVSVGAILIALPLGLAAAIYLAEIADERVRKVLKPIIELLAGIPSVVYGFFGLVVVVPLIQQLFGLPVGETGLAGSIILAIMALPTIITVSEDAMRTTPRAMKEASLALGATHWQTIYKVIIPYSGSGISTAAILGIGRAIGETMAVLMVTGNAATIPHTLLAPVRTIPATIAAELGEAPVGGVHYNALFALGCILFLITLFINITVAFVSSKGRISKK